MRRGDLVVTALSGDFGKPRPVVVIQSDDFEATSTVTVLLMTSEIHDLPLLRITIEPTPLNGLRAPSQIMIDRTMTTWRDQVSEPIGRLTHEQLTQVERQIALLLGFG